MKVRKMVNSDFPKLYTFWKKAGLTLAKFNREKQEFNSLLKHNPKSTLILEENGKMIGAVIGAYNGRRGWIYHLAIDKKYQKKGFGSFLYKTVEKKLKDQGATKILLGVDYSKLKITSFYTKHGFTVMNDAVVMIKDLWEEEKK